MNPILTIIIPTYNVKRYLPTCIESVWRAANLCAMKTGRIVQIIAVDDGATDGSGEMLDQYKSQMSDSSVILEVLHQPNGGVSVARNNGLSHAMGEWVHFVDADDWVADNLYADIMSKVLLYQDADSYVFVTTWLNEDGTVEKEFGAGAPNIRVSGDDLLGHKTYSFFAGCIWNKIYRLSVIRKTGLSFLKGVQPAEDDLFNMLFLSYDTTVRICSDVKGYLYRATPGSSVHTMNVKKKMFAADQFSGLYHRWLDIRTPGLRRMLQALSKRLIFLGSRTTVEGRSACINALLGSIIFNSEVISFMLWHGTFEERVFATLYRVAPRFLRTRLLLKVAR